MKYKFEMSGGFGNVYSNKEHIQSGKKALDPQEYIKELTFNGLDSYFRGNFIRFTFVNNRYVRNEVVRNFPVTERDTMRLATGSCELS